MNKKTIFRFFIFISINVLSILSAFSLKACALGIAVSPGSIEFSDKQEKSFFIVNPNNIAADFRITDDSGMFSYSKKDGELCPGCRETISASPIKWKRGIYNARIMLIGRNASELAIIPSVSINLIIREDANSSIQGIIAGKSPNEKSAAEGLFVTAITVFLGMIGYKTYGRKRN